MQPARGLPELIDPADRQSYPALPVSGIHSLTLKFLPVRKGMEITSGRQALKRRKHFSHSEFSTSKSGLSAVLRCQVDLQPERSHS